LKAEENSKKGSNPPLMIETVNVDDAENKPDHNGHGSVNHHFKIGKFDVTAREWCVFLNAVATKGFPADPFHLFNTKMQIDSFVSCIKKVTSPGGTISYKVISKKDGDKEAAGDEDSLDRGQLPITYIDFFAAVRFCNWLSHGQPDSGEENKTTTEDGPYTINGTLCHANFSENQESYDQSKWPGGFWRLPSDDEWYKAAYYDKANSDHEGQYWLYSTSEGNQPFNSIEEVYNQPIATEGAFQNVNYHLIYTDHTTGQLVDRFTKENLPFITPVGIFKYSPGPFGTYDMGGNVAQWTDSRSFVRKSDDSLVTMETTMIRGGSWKSTSPREISSENYVFIDQKSNDSQEHGSQGLSLLQYASNDVGFRVVLIEPKDTSFYGMYEKSKEVISQDVHDVYNPKEGFSTLAQHPDVLYRTIDYGIGAGIGGSWHVFLLGLKHFLEIFINGIISAIKWIGNWLIPDCLRDAFQTLFRCFQAAPVAEGTAEGVIVDAAQTGMGALCTQFGTMLTQLYSVSPTLATAIISGSLGYALYAYNADPEHSSRMAVGLEAYAGGLIGYVCTLCAGAAPFLQGIIGTAI
jgi:formylglycine-generating enzyme required for sulfatase activity